MPRDRHKEPAEIKRKALREANKAKMRPTGTTVPELDFKRIEFSKAEIAKARGNAAAGSKDAEDAKILLEHLGLMPDQSDWFYDKTEKTDGAGS